jgi:hypothetical protein
MPMTACDYAAFFFFLLANGAVINPALCYCTLSAEVTSSSKTQSMIASTCGYAAFPPE